MHTHTPPPLQVAYCEVAAAVKARCCLQLGRLADVLTGLEVQWEGEEELRNAAWRLWLGMQVRLWLGLPP